MCWPCAEGDHKRCDRKRGVSYTPPYSVWPNPQVRAGTEMLVRCDCDPEHRLKYER